MHRCAALPRVLGMLVLGTLVLAIPSQARADPANEDAGRLPALLKAGAVASRAKQWDACIKSYSDALELAETPSSFGELGLCEEAAGRFASAHPHLVRATAGLAPGDEPRKRYQAALGRVAQQVAIVIVTVTPTDARLVVDGRPLGLGEGRNVAVEPGNHVFAARLPGHVDKSKSITVNARELPHLELALDPLPRIVAPALPPPVSLRAAPVAESRPASSLPVPLAWCVPAGSARGVLGPAACTGVVALAASAGTAIGLTAHWQSMRDAIVARGGTAGSCAGGQAGASTECAELHSRRLQRDTAQDVLIGTGIAAGVLVGAASVAIAVEPLGPRITATAGPDGGGIVLQGTW